MYNKNTLSLDEYNLLTLNMGDLTESEYRLNEYINKHFNELPYHGIVDLSQNAMVSKATIGRFLNKMGFTGYAAFRKALDITLSKNKISAPFEKNIKLRNNPGITTESIVTDFTYKVSELFNQFKNNIDIESLNAFIDLVLNNKRHIYVVGPSSSHAMATHFCTLLKYFRSNISLLPTDIPFFKAVFLASFLSNSFYIWLMRKEIARGILPNWKNYSSFSKHFRHRPTILSATNRQESYPSRRHDESGNICGFHAIELSDSLSD